MGLWDVMDNPTVHGTVMEIYGISGHLWRMKYDML